MADPAGYRELRLVKLGARAALQLHTQLLSHTIFYLVSWQTNDTRTVRLQTGCCDKAMECQREKWDFPVDQRLSYLNCAYLGPLPTKTKVIAQQNANRQAAPWEHLAGKPGEQLSSFYTDVENCRGLFAQLINANADDIAIVPATSCKQTESTWTAGLSMTTR